MKRRFTRGAAWVLLLVMILSFFTGCAQFHPHKFGPWETLYEATCTREGVKYRSCSCGEVETMNVAQQNHVEGQWVTVKESTFQLNGSRELHCLHCGAVLQIEMLPLLDPSDDANPPKDKEYVITVLTQRQGDYGYLGDGEELWFFRYMEYWFAQQGYDVDIQVHQSNEINQTKKLALNTDTLPDLWWGVELTNAEVLRYAVEEGMILEWTPYINEYLMPNVAACFEKQPESKTLSQAPNGGIYGLPYYNPSVYGSGCYGLSQRLYFRQSWLDQVGLGNPVTKTELLNVLRAFKNQITDKTADRQDVPLVSGDGLLEKYLWTCMGFYGCEPDRFGSSLSIKDGELVLPAYTESYREFVTIMKTMYGEGLIGKNFFDYDNASAGHQIGLDQCGALCWENLACVGEDFSDIVCANLIPMGDVDSITDIHASLPASVYPNYIWANSRYEEPRILAMLIDFVYSEEGAWLYRYGPKQGEDPLGLVDGWYLDDSGNVTTKQVEEGKYASMAAYGSTVLFPNDYVGMCRAAIHATTDAMVELTDSVTGETYYCVDTGSVSGDTNDGYWQQITMQKWSDRATSVRIPAVYLNADEMPEFTDYKNAISAWVRSETAKFITGVRPVSEIEEFWKELENLGVERYLQLAKEGCADWMKATFG